MSMIWTAARVDPGEVHRVLADPGSVWDHLDADGDGVLDLEKAWHGVHVLLNDDIGAVTRPAGALVLGGEPVGPDGGDADGGYGPARLHRPDAVLAAAQDLHALDLTAVLAGYRPDAWDADGVYPSGWQEGDELAVLLPALQELRTFLVTAARQGQAVVSAIH